MPRTARVAPGGMVFHVLNRGVARMQLFEKAADYQAFEQVLRDTLDQSPMRICAYAVMPNHWHLLLWPECDGELAAFMQRLTITHVRRWQEHRGYAGLGHVYQGRYKSFPVKSDEHSWVVARYVERNALRQSRLASGGMAVVKLVAALSSYGRRAVVVGGVADRYASELARAGQSNRRRAGTGSSFAAACNEAAPLASRNGRRKSRNVWASSRPIVPRVARERWAEIKMPRPGEDRSNVGGAAQFNNIGPVPLSRSLSRFPLRPSSSRGLHKSANHLAIVYAVTAGSLSSCSRWSRTTRADCLDSVLTY